MSDVLRSDPLSSNSIAKSSSNCSFVNLLHISSLTINITSVSKILIFFEKKKFLENYYTLKIIPNQQITDRELAWDVTILSSIKNVLCVWGAGDRSTKKLFYLGCEVQIASTHLFFNFTV